MTKRDVEIVSRKEAWSEFTLADGRVIRAKCVVTDVVDTGEVKDGEPVYNTQLQTLLKVAPK